jgi:hypothetical protein
MKASFYLSLAFSIACAASYVRAPTPLATLTVPIPSQGVGFTSTISACDTVDPFVVVGFPNGSLVPGTQTYYVPPQVDATTSTFTDPQLNATEVIVIEPLPGSCEPFSPDVTVTSSNGPAPTDGSGSPDVCALEGCSKIVNQAAGKIIDALNKVTALSQNLQSAAKRIGLKRDTALEARDPLSDLLTGLRRVPPLLTSIVPYVQNSPPIPPGCDSDTIVVALIDFVRVHQALLEILIGRSSILSSGSGFGFGKRGEYEALEEFDESILPRDLSDPSAPGSKKFPNPLGIAVAAVLRTIESVVDNIAFGLIALIPTRDPCLRQQKFSIDGTLNDAIAAYST